jgi:hypothetical protein
MKKNFDEFIDNLQSSIKNYEYFVNWEKVFKNKDDAEIMLNTLNYILGKDNLEIEFKKLFELDKKIVKVLPLLLAVREKNLDIFDENKNSYDQIDFINIDSDYKKYYNFIKKTGLIKVFSKSGVKNLVDYALGIEVGLESNGRKNRGGVLMENLVESHVKKLCQNRGFIYLKQASSKKMLDNFNHQFGITNRTFDFIIMNIKSRKTKLIEVNFYNGGGSKLKAVCGEFDLLFTEAKKFGYELIWITDGKGWISSKKQLKDVFDKHKNIFNINDLNNNILDRLDW